MKRTTSLGVCPARSRKVVTTLLLCLASQYGCSPNHRYFEKGNVRCGGKIEGGRAAYTFVTIGTPQDPFCDLITAYEDVALEIDGSLMRLGDLTVDRLRDLRAKIGPQKEAGWPSGSEKLQLDGRLFFCVFEGKILQLYVNGVNAPQGPCWSSSADERICMPFDDDGAAELFGKPDKVISNWHS
jgi:hypothetical protein